MVMKEPSATYWFYCIRQPLDMQCTTRRVNSKQDLFNALTSVSIVRDHHNRITYIDLWS